MSRAGGLLALALAVVAAAPKPAMAQDPPLVLVHCFKSSGTA